MQLPFLEHLSNISLGVRTDAPGDQNGGNDDESESMPNTKALTTVDSVKLLSMLMRKLNLLHHNSTMATSNESRLQYMPELEEDWYYVIIAQFYCEPFAEFSEPEIDFDSFDNLENYKPKMTLLDYLTSIKYSNENMVSAIAREQSFVDGNAPFVSIKSLNSQTYANTSAIVNIESLVEAGFYYEERQDSSERSGVSDTASAVSSAASANDRVRCFWCGLGLNSWEENDVPMEVHAIWSPLCPWVLRSCGRAFVRKALLKSTHVAGQSVAGAMVLNDTTLHILRNWEEPRG